MEFSANVSDSIMSSERLSLVTGGDSIMVGVGSTSMGGWRFGLFSQLNSRVGYAPKFVGRDWANNFLFPQCGVSGDTSTQLLARVQTQSPLFPNTRIGLLEIGINDILSGVQTATILANTNSILDRWRTDSPGMTIWVANLIDRSGSTSAVNAYNSALAVSLAGRSDWSATNVLGKTMLIDMFSVLGPYNAANYSDLIHPNATGYALMTTGWFNQIATLF